jgi:hypothetical protein
MLLVPAVELEPPLDEPAFELLPAVPPPLAGESSPPQARSTELAKPARRSQRALPDNMTVTFPKVGVSRAGGLKTARKIQPD